MDDLKQLQQILEDSVIGSILPAIAKLNLSDWWLAGGAVRNTVWQTMFGEDCQLVINDFDIAFFDLTGNRDQELAAKAALTEKFPESKFDVKNQASFARWRTGRRPYQSTEDGVADWLHTATAVGIRCNEQGQWQFFVPYGLSDLFQGIIRPTPAHIDNPDAERKAASFLERCPRLRLADNSEGATEMSRPE